tara:strand:- start:314 stop:532 length:219 start_codon:yes stop_codon:yes gene_type:complete
MMEKVYHIYAKQECLFNNLTETQFNTTWETLKGMVGLMKTDYELEDLSYEEVVRAHGGGSENSNEPSGSDSY